MERRSFLALSTGFLAGCLNESNSETKKALFSVDRPNNVSGKSFPVPDEPIPDSVKVEVVTNKVSRSTEMVFLPGQNIKYISQRSGEVLLHDSDGIS